MPGLVIASDKHLTGVIHHLSPSCKNNHTLVRCNCIPFSLPFPEAPKFIVPLRGPTSSTSKGFLDVYVNPGDSKHSILRDERLAWESHSNGWPHVDLSGPKQLPKEGLPSLPNLMAEREQVQANAGFKLRILAQKEWKFVHGWIKCKLQSKTYLTAAKQAIQTGTW